MKRDIILCNNCLYSLNSESFVGRFLALTRLVVLVLNNKCVRDYLNIPLCDLFIFKHTLAEIKKAQASKEALDSFFNNHIVIATIQKLKEVRS